MYRHDTLKPCESTGEWAGDISRRFAAILVSKCLEPSALDERLYDPVGHVRRNDKGGLNKNHRTKEMR
jgi:hypothetical protein